MRAPAEPNDSVCHLPTHIQGLCVQHVHHLLGSYHFSPQPLPPGAPTASSLISQRRALFHVAELDLPRRFVWLHLLAQWLDWSWLSWGP